MALVDNDDGMGDDDDGDEKMMMMRLSSYTAVKAISGVRALVVFGVRVRRVLLHLHDDLFFMRIDKLFQNLHDDDVVQILLSFASILELASGKSVEVLCCSNISQASQMTRFQSIACPPTMKLVNLPARQC